MRLHSVHPQGFCFRQSRADIEIEGCALFFALIFVVKQYTLSYIRTVVYFLNQLTNAL